MLWLHPSELLLLGSSGVTLAAIVMDPSKIDLSDPYAPLLATGQYSMASMEAFNGGDFITVKDAVFDATDDNIFIFWQSSDQIGVTRNFYQANTILHHDNTKRGLMMAHPQAGTELLAGSHSGADMVFMLLKQTQIGDFNAVYLVNF